MSGNGNTIPWEGVAVPRFDNPAACAKVDPELFFRPDNDHAERGALDRARRVCRRCPALLECRRFALSLPDVHGVWGGLSRSERQKIRKRRQRPVTAGSSGWRPA